MMAESFTYSAGKVRKVRTVRKGRHAVAHPHRARRRSVMIVTLTTALALSGVAVAQWLAGGDGNGFAKGANALQNLTLQDIPTGQLTGDLVPNGNAGLRLRIVNPNPLALTLTTVNGTTAIQSDDPANCPASNVTFTDQTGLSIPIPANANPANVTVPNAVHMSANAPTGCQGVRFTIPVQVAAATA